MAKKYDKKLLSQKILYFPSFLQSYDAEKSIATINLPFKAITKLGIDKDTEFNVFLFRNDKRRYVKEDISLECDEDSRKDLLRNLNRQVIKTNLGFADAVKEAYELGFKEGYDKSKKE